MPGTRPYPLALIPLVLSLSCLPAWTWAADTDEDEDIVIEIVDEMDADVGEVLIEDEEAPTDEALDALVNQSDAPAAGGAEVMIDGLDEAGEDAAELVIDDGETPAEDAAEIVIDDGEAPTEDAAEIVIDDSEAPPVEADEVVIDDDTMPTDEAPEFVVDDAAEPGADEERLIGAPGDVDTELAQGAAATGSDTPSGIEIRLDDAWLELGHFGDSNAAADRSVYGKLAAEARWQPAPDWEVQIAGRIDAHSQDGGESFAEIKGDYGDSFVRYRGERFNITLGSQTVIWGRLDELPLSDRVSTVDLTRFILDDLADRRRSSPVLRAETFFSGGKLDLVWLYDFRAAELPDKDSVWYPINTRTGRVLGIDPDDVPSASVIGAKVSENRPDGDGGVGMRYTRTHSFADIGVTVAHTRQSTPYFRATAPGRFEAEYPRSWAYGADAAIDAGGATWRLEVLYNSDTPVTRRDLSYTTTPSVTWGGGVEFHPGDGNSRVNLQLVGMNLVDAPAVIDRSDIYSLNGEIEIPFDRERWRAELDFYIGIGDKDVYLNPEIAFLGWEPHEVYLSLHYFDGSDQTVGGFHQDHSSINLGWRTSF